MDRHEQQLVDEGFLVHHVGHVGDVEAAELWAVAQHHVSNLGDQHTLSQPLLQVHEEAARDQLQVEVEEKHVGGAMWSSASLSVNLSLAVVTPQMFENNVWCSSLDRVFFSGLDA